MAGHLHLHSITISSSTTYPLTPLKFTILPSISLKFPSSSSALRLRRQSYPFIKATVASPQSTLTQDGGAWKPNQPLIVIKDLKAVITESNQEILKGVNLIINEGEVHAIMGKNGSGKSTLSKVITGHPDYEVTGGSITFKGENLLEMEPEERSLAGIFMSFQSPVEIPGVNIVDFLLMAYNERRKKLGEPELGPLEFYQYLSTKLDLVNMKPDFLGRNVNDDLSGGEKKRNEILQLAVLGADLAILDEIDSGLDVDALRDVGKAVNALLTSRKSVLMITHYMRIFDAIQPTYIHIMDDGRIVKTGDISLAKLLEIEGYKAYSTT
ncbi:hypothetical protein ACFE04_003627 [Oxalis oulophora]